MDANPEVMPAVATPSTRQVLQPPLRPGRTEPPATTVASAKSPAAVRLSEDPMRRTDRYRLVMPWSRLP